MVEPCADDRTEDREVNMWRIDRFPWHIGDERLHHWSWPIGAVRTAMVMMHETHMRVPMSTVTAQSTASATHEDTWSHRLLTTGVRTER